METVINYIVESSIGLGVLIIIYRLLLRNRSNLSFNRFYLVFSIIFCAGLPLMSFSLKYSPENMHLPEFIVGSQSTLILDTITVYSARANQKIVVLLKELPWMKIIYLTGFFILIFRIFFGLYRLRIFKRRAMLKKFPKYTLIETNTELEPFSFFRFLFINRGMYDDKEFQVIINHELAHIQLKHSVDNLFVEIMLIIQWFNPFVWILRRDLREVQEFQADRSTIRTGINPLFYKELLLSRAMGTRFAFGNNFNQLLIKKRLKMINSKINQSIGFVRLSAMTIVVGLLFVVFACEQKSTSEQEVYTQVEIMPEFPGGFDGVRSFLGENLNYPENAEKLGIQGRVFISFVISEKGEVTNAKVERGVDPELDAEALRVINQLPDWTPGIEDGKKVPVKYTMPIVFKLEETKDVFYIVEDMPKFDGGMDGMRDFIRKNILYPSEAKNKSVEGKALVDFIVDKTGKVTRVKIRESTGNEYLDKEAVRVIQSMPDWEPGSQRGQKVNVQYSIPIEFLMTDTGGAIVVKESKTVGEKMDVKVSFESMNNKINATGTVRDKSGKPLLGASIVIKGTSKGTVTDEKGNFTIDLDTESQELVFSFVGKETVVVQQ